MELKKMFQEYLNYLKDFKKAGYYDFTKRHINVILNYFESNNIKTTDQIDYDLIYEYLKYLRTHGNCNSTIKKKFDIIKRSLAFNSIDIDLSKIKIGSIQNKRFKIFNDHELKMIINYYMNLNLSIPQNFTKYITIMLLLHTGIRRTELSNIKISHIDFNSNTIYLDETKTGNDRLLFFRSYLIDDLKKYIDLNPDRKYLLWNFKNDCQLSPRNITDFIRYDREKIGLKRFSPHMFRHTFATMLLENGGELSSVKLLLGHQSIKTTEIYLHLSDQFVRTDYDKYAFSIA